MSDNKTPPPLYDESMILRLKPIEHVRFRPGMYIGGVDEAASYHLLFEFIDYLVRKHDFAGIYGDTVGRCDQLTITLLDDYWISISSNGPSIRVDKDTQLEKAIVELLMTLGWGQISLVQCVMLNALSSDLKITLKRDGYSWEQTYQQGKPQTDLIKVRPLEPPENTGMVFSFRLDFSILDPFDLSNAKLSSRLRTLAFLNPDLTIILRDERSQAEKKHTEFHYENGLADYVAYLNRDYTPVHPVVYAKSEVEFERRENDKFLIGVEVAFQYVQEPTTIRVSFANTREPSDGGTHLEGFTQALWGSIEGLDEKKAIFNHRYRLNSDDVLNGLTAVVSVHHPYIAYVGSMRYEVLNPELKDIVYDVTQECIENFAAQNPDAAQRILDKCLENKRQRDQRAFDE